MYGVVNLAIEDLIVTEYGEQVWDEIRQTAGVDHIETFVVAQQYPDEVTYALVATISKRLGIPSTETLRLFGRHWIQYTLRNHHGQLLQFAGTTVREFIGNVDLIHANVAASMPGLKVPTIDVEDIQEDHFLVHYRSPRDGFAPMLVGMLEGIALHCESRIEIEHRHRKSDGADHDIFSVRVPVTCP